MQTSFIPKKPISPAPISYENRGVSIVTIITVIIFFGSVALSLGSYLYMGILEKRLEAKKVDLEKARNSFDLDTIRDLKRLDMRMKSAETLLQNHIAFSSYFELLEDITLRSVRFGTLTINDSSSSLSETTVSDSKPLTFKLTGTARGYTGVALQSDLFSKVRAKGIMQPVFSNLQLDDRGRVNFTAEAQIDRKALRYSSTLGLQSTPSGTQQSSVGTSSSATTTP